MTTEGMPQPGQRLGQYTITEFRAQGGMGIVYRARDNRLQRDVALKVLFPHLTADADFAARFRREAVAMAQMQHPNIVQVFDADEVDGVHYLAMEYVPGDNLYGLMQKYRAAGQVMSEQMALTITRQIASALDYAHRKGLVHRDVKPSNIMCAADDRWVLADFGIVLDTSGPRLTKVMTSIGTPEYMSPEQGLGQTMDGRSDQYSLGIVLYEMLAGKAPFASDSALGTIYKHAHEPLPDLGALRKDLSKTTLRVLQRSTAKQPDARFQSDADMVRGIDVALGNAPDSASIWSASGPRTPSGGVARGPAPIPGSAPTAVLSTPRQTGRVAQPRGSSGGGGALGKVVAGIGAALLLLIGVFAAALFGILKMPGSQATAPTVDVAAVATAAVGTAAAQQTQQAGTQVAALSAARNSADATATAQAAATGSAKISADATALRSESNATSVAVSTLVAQATRDALASLATVEAAKATATPEPATVAAPSATPKTQPPSPTPAPPTATSAPAPAVAAMAVQVREGRAGYEAWGRAVITDPCTPNNKNGQGYRFAMNIDITNQGSADLTGFRFGFTGNPGSPYSIAACPEGVPPVIKPGQTFGPIRIYAFLDARGGIASMVTLAKTNGVDGAPVRVCFNDIIASAC